MVSYSTEFLCRYLPFIQRLVDISFAVSFGMSDISAPAAANKQSPHQFLLIRKNLFWKEAGQAAMELPPAFQFQFAALRMNQFNPGNNLVVVQWSFFRKVEKTAQVKSYFVVLVLYPWWCILYDVGRQGLEQESGSGTWTWLDMIHSWILASKILSLLRISGEVMSK